MQLKQHFKYFCNIIFLYIFFNTVAQPVSVQLTCDLHHKDHYLPLLETTCSDRRSTRVETLAWTYTLYREVNEPENPGLEFDFLNYYYYYYY